MGRRILGDNNGLLMHRSSLPMLCGDNNDDASDVSQDAEICEEFWKFVHGILAKATPMGFTELPDPESVIPKCKKDADAFLMKAVSIGVINPIHPTVIAKESGIDHETIMEELL
eukprot:15333897-Ditylum_brightwellii.AAC.2